METNHNYHDELAKKNIEKLRELLNTLPSFCKMYFRGMNDTISSRTKIAYAYDLRVFFEFIMKAKKLDTKYDMPDIPMSVLDQIKREDIEDYLEYLAILKSLRLTKNIMTIHTSLKERKLLKNGKSVSVI